MIIKVERVREDAFWLRVEGRSEHDQFIRGYSYLTEDLGHLLSRTLAIKAERIGGVVKIEITRE